MDGESLRHWQRKRPGILLHLFKGSFKGVEGEFKIPHFHF
jgi:hypothetical protein